MKQLVILLHGYGSDGHDLQGLGEFWAGALPGLQYAAPNAPEPCEAGLGFQWFSLANLTPENGHQRLIDARKAIDLILTNTLAQHKMTASDPIILVGFSQGTMIALDLLLQGGYNVIGVVGFSGRLLDVPATVPPTNAKVLLVHGAADDVVPSTESVAAKQVFSDLGIDCEVIIEPELVHTISAAGVEAATQFLIECLGWEDEEDEE